MQISWLCGKLCYNIYTFTAERTTKEIIYYLINISLSTPFHNFGHVQILVYCILLSIYQGPLQTVPTLRCGTRYWRLMDALQRTVLMLKPSHLSTRYAIMRLLNYFFQSLKLKTTGYIPGTDDFLRNELRTAKTLIKS